MPRSLQTARLAAAILRLLLLYALFCALSLALLLALRERIEAGPFAAAPQPPADAPASQLPFAGVNVDLYQYISADEQRLALVRLREAGFGWVRQRVDWGELEPAPSVFRWQRTDALVDAILDADLVPVFVLDGSPAWARAPRDVDNPLAPPEEFNNFARFASAFAQRYGDKARFYQIWDEPNVAPHWGDRLIEPVAYARMLEAVAPAIRAADADAVIALAALAPTADRGHTAVDEVYFLRRLYAAGAAPHFDVVAIQPFGFGLAPDDPRSRTQVLNFQRARLIRRVMLAAGDGETPIWAVRFGWNRATNHVWRTVTPSAQVQFMAASIARAQAEWPWLAAMAWPIDKPDAPPDDPLWGFALVTADGAATPLLEAFTQVNRQPVPVAPPPTPTPLLPWLLAGGMVFALWRGGMTVQLLPVGSWLARVRRAHTTTRILLWATLGAIYYFGTWPPLIGLCWLAAVFLVAARPGDGLVLMATLLPFHFRHKEIDLLLVTWTLPPAQAVLLATVPAVAGRLTRQRDRSFLGIKWQALDGLAIGWLALSLLSAVNVWHWPGYATGLWDLALVPLLFYLCARTLIGDAATWRHVIIGLGVGGATAALIGFLLWMAGDGVGVDGVRRLVGLTFSPNQTALYLLRSLFVLIGLVAADGGHRRWIWISACLVVAATLLLTRSRGALLLGVPMGTGFLWILGNSRGISPRARLRGGVVASALVGVGLLLLGDRLLNSETVVRRFHIWEGALSLWWAHPLLGVGPNGFFWSYPAFMLPAAADEPNLLHAHNLWLNVATGWGMLGLLWLTALLIWLGRVGIEVRRRGNWVRAGLFTATIAALFHAQVDAFLMLPELAAWNWLALALLAQPHRSPPLGLRGGLPPS